MEQYPDGLTELIVALNTSMVDEENLDATLGRVAFLCCHSAIGADNAGVTLRREGRPATAAFYGDAALPLDEAQYAADDGPCLAAYRTGQRFLLEIIDEERQRWPAFVKAASDHGIVSSLSFPLRLKDEVVGALNMYSSQPLSFTEERVQLASAFSEQVALAITNADMYWRTYALTQNLILALENRDRIGQAKGVLASRLGITMDEAFEQLRRCSQHLNMKLRDVADQVAITGELPERRP